MDASLINPFIQGAQLVFNLICKESPKLGQLSVKKQPYAALPLSVAVSIIGDVKGEVVYNMKMEDGCFIASQMMGGMPLSTLDAISESALSELANMISGNVATIFSGKELKVDITTPRFKMNAAAADFPVVQAFDKIVSIPLKFANGRTVEMDIVLA